MTAPGSILAAMRTFLDSGADDTIGSFLEDMDWSMAPRRLEPAGLPCLEHLAAIAPEDETALARLTHCLIENRHGLRWGQTYSAADFGPKFLRNYGWTEIFGTRGHFRNAGMAGGFLVLGPDIEYPDHRHVAEEIYLPLTGGTEWRAGGSAYKMREAGAIVHHPSNVSHAMRTGASPLLALYLWRGGPLDQRSEIGRD